MLQSVKWAHRMRSARNLSEWATWCRLPPPLPPHFYPCANTVFVVLIVIVVVFVVSIFIVVIFILVIVFYSFMLGHVLHVRHVSESRPFFDVAPRHLLVLLHHLPWLLRHLRHLRQPNHMHRQIAISPALIATSLASLTQPKSYAPPNCYITCLDCYVSCVTYATQATWTCQLLRQPPLPRHPRHLNLPELQTGCAGNLSQTNW